MAGLIVKHHGIILVQTIFCMLLIVSHALGLCIYVSVNVSCNMRAMVCIFAWLYQICAIAQKLIYWNEGGNQIQPKNIHKASGILIRHTDLKHFVLVCLVVVCVVCFVELNTGQQAAVSLDLLCLSWYKGKHPQPLWVNCP